MTPGGSSGFRDGPVSGTRNVMSLALAIANDVARPRKELKARERPAYASSFVACFLAVFLTDFFVVFLAVFFFAVFLAVFFFFGSTRSIVTLG
ncbi:MAG: hypothetical protein AAGK78_11265, partial [Planctomycetota bacterium]